MKKGFEQRLKDDWKGVEKTLVALEEAQDITYEILRLEINTPPKKYSYLTRA